MDHTTLAGHFHAYVQVAGVDYRAACCPTWAAALRGLRDMGYAGAMPADRTEEWQAVPRRDGDYPPASIQYETGAFDTCEPDKE